jgi:anti-anti-sigma factor
MDGAQLLTSACDGFVVAALRGDFDFKDADDVAAELGRLASGGEFLIVDMSAVGFVDCAAVGALLRARQAAALDGGDMVLVGPHGYAARILDLTGMGEAIRSFCSLRDAVVTIAGMPSRHFAQAAPATAPA